MEKTTERLAAFAKEHVGLVVALAGVMLVSLRLLAVAAFDPSSALAVLQSLGTSDVAVGTVLTVLPVLPHIALVALTFGIPAKQRPWREALRLWLLGAFPAVAMLFSPVPEVLTGFFLGLWAVTPVVSIALRDPAGASRPETPEGALKWLMRGAFRIATVYVVAQFAAGVIVDRQMWLPVESVAVGGTTHVGYVLSADDRTTVLLRDSDRAVLHLARAESRTLCLPANRLSVRPIAARLGWVPRKGPEYPRCPVV